jgi:hypothetical protein
MKRFIYKAFLVALPIAPMFALAQTNDFSSVTGSITSVKDIINSLIPLVIGIGVLVFLWGLVGYVTAGGDEEKRKNARSLMIYGIIVLFVMVSVWGLVKVLVTTFGTGTQTTAPVIPQI